MSLTNFDVIDADNIIQRMLFTEFRETEPFSERFGEVGYDTSNFFFECGLLFVIASIFLFFWVPLRMLLRFMTRKCRQNFITKWT